MYRNCPNDSISHEIKALGHIMQRKMLTTAKSKNIDSVTLMHGWIIGYLYHNRDKNIYQKNIESQFAISRSTVTNILKLMEKKGYINRVSVDNDARLKKIILTEEGIRINNDLESTFVENENCINSILSYDEKDTLIRLMQKLRDGLENS